MVSFILFCAADVIIVAALGTLAVASPGDLPPVAAMGVPPWRGARAPRDWSGVTGVGNVDAAVATPSFLTLGDTLVDLLVIGFLRLAAALYGRYCLG